MITAAAAQLESPGMLLLGRSPNCPFLQSIPYNFGRGRISSLAWRLGIGTSMIKLLDYRCERVRNTVICGGFLRRCRAWQGCPIESNDSISRISRVSSSRCDGLSRYAYPNRKGRMPTIAGTALYIVHIYTLYLYIMSKTASQREASQLSCFFRDGWSRRSFWTSAAG